MTHPASDWYQQSLIPPEVVEVRIRLGLVPETDHTQAMVEMFDPMTGAVLAQWSAPHGPLAHWYRLLDEAVRKTQEFIGSVVQPF